MWLYVPNCLPDPTSACSPAQEVLTSPSASLLQTLAASVTSRGSLRQPRFWRRALGRELLTTPLCGLTCAPSTVARGVAAWLASLAVSPARTSPWPESALASSAATAADCSTSTCGSFARFSPAGSLLKTSAQSLLFQREESFSESLPAWGSMRSGVLLRRATWVPATNATASSFWPTADAQVMNDGESEETWLARREVLKAKKNNGNGMGTPLAMASVMWSTPLVNDVEKRGNFDTERTKCLASEAIMWPAATSSMTTGFGVESRDGGPNLQSAALLWQSPRASDGEKGGPNQRGSKGDPMLSAQAAMWKSPNVCSPNSLRGSGQSASARQAQGHQVNLQDQVHEWEPGRSAQPTRAGRTCWCGIPGCALRSHRRKLNPVFVEWLMGWPLCWTDALTAFDSAATEWYLCRARQLLQSFSGALSAGSEAVA